MEGSPGAARRVRDVEIAVRLAIDRCARHEVLKRKFCELKIVDCAVETGLRAENESPAQLPERSGKAQGERGPAAQPGEGPRRPHAQAVELELASIGPGDRDAAGAHAEAEKGNARAHARDGDLRAEALGCLRGDGGREAVIGKAAKREQQCEQGGGEGNHPGPYPARELQRSGRGGGLRGRRHYVGSKDDTVNVTSRRSGLSARVRTRRLLIESSCGADSMPCK